MTWISDYMAHWACLKCLVHQHQKGSNPFPIILHSILPWCYLWKLDIWHGMINSIDVMQHAIWMKDEALLIFFLFSPPRQDMLSCFRMKAYGCHCVMGVVSSFNMPWISWPSKQLSASQWLLYWDSLKPMSFSFCFWWESDCIWHGQ